MIDEIDTDHIRERGKGSTVPLLATLEDSIVVTDVVAAVVFFVKQQICVAVGVEAVAARV